MVIGQECGQFDFRRILRELSIGDIRLWAALFRLQKKDMDKDAQDGEASAAKARAQQKLARSPAE